MPPAAMRVGDTAAFYGDKHQEMPLGALRLLGLSRGDFTWEQRMGFGSLGFASCGGSGVFWAGVSGGS